MKFMLAALIAAIPLGLLAHPEPKPIKGEPITIDTEWSVYKMPKTQKGYPYVCYLRGVGSEVIGQGLFIGERPWTLVMFKTPPMAWGEEPSGAVCIEYND